MVKDDGKASKEITWGMRDQIGPMLELRIPSKVSQEIAAAIKESIYERFEREMKKAIGEQMVLPPSVLSGTSTSPSSPPMTSSEFSQRLIPQLYELCRRFKHPPFKLVMDATHQGPISPEPPAEDGIVRYRCGWRQLLDIYMIIPLTIDRVESPTKIHFKPRPGLGNFFDPGIQGEKFR